MEFFKPGLHIDFMKRRSVLMTGSLVLAFLSFVSLFWPGPNFGIDFRGGTELELKFKGDMGTQRVRDALMDLGYDRPDVVQVEGKKGQYIVRVQEVSALPEAQVKKIRSTLDGALGDVKVDELKPSPGGDSVAVRFTGQAQVETIEGALKGAGLNVRAVSIYGRAEDNRFEVRLAGVADEIVAGLQAKLGEQGPDAPLRVEWIGPKAGKQLRDSAIKAILYTLAFIMVYVAVRFDLRFAPGGIVALLHDALITMGAYVLLQREVTLATVAAILTIIGFSINDTIVIYDRIRENMARMRDASMSHLINVSTSQTLSRTIITSLTAELSMAAYFFWGTPAIKDMAFALIIGFIAGTYSSVYVAAPLTEWIDRRFFRKA